jgi:hypothetical protein
LTHTPFLSGDHLFALKTGFAEETLKQGLELLRQQQVSFFSFQRRWAGLLLADGTKVFLHMGQGKERHTFVFRDGDCEACGWQTGGNYCCHTAALVLLCLRPHKEQLRPLADIFPDSPWSAVAAFLYEQTTLGKRITSTLEQKEEGWLLTAVSDQGLMLRVALTAESASESASLFPTIVKVTSEHDSRNRTRRRELIGDLTSRVVGKNEALLNAHDKQSRQQHLEASLWAQLAKLLFLHLPDTTLRASRDRQGIYTLHSGALENSIFRLSLPRKPPGRGHGNRPHWCPGGDPLRSLVESSKGRTGHGQSPPHGEKHPVQVIPVASADSGKEILVKKE